MPTRVLLVDDDARFRHSTERVLACDPGLLVVGSEASAEAAIRRAEAAVASGVRRPWDVMVSDLEMPGCGGIAGICRVKTLLPDTAAVALTVFEDPATVLEAIHAGADGYVTKDAGVDYVIEVVHTVAQGGAPLTANVARALLDVVRRETSAPGRTPTRLHMTPREQDVLRALVDGLSYKQAADRIGISAETVRGYVRSLYAKLRVHSVSEAVVKAVREGLV